MTKKQILTIIFSGILFLGLYFGTDIRATKQDSINKTRNLESEGIGIGSFLKLAKEQIEPSKLTFIELSEEKLKGVTDTQARIVILKDLASAWYKYEQPTISGFYAIEIAKLESNENAWSIAGTTFLIGLQNATDQLKRTYCTEQGVKSFENAISINPENINHKLNLALMYVENAPKDTPMKGILMLLDLNKKYPDNVPTLLALGRLGLKTNQLEKAIARLEKVMALDSENNIATCLLAEAYGKFGNQEKANEFSRKCSR